MRRYTRIVFGLNALYQTVIGLVCMLAPAVAIGLYGGTDADSNSSILMVVFRLLGVNLIPMGVISALVAGNPDANPPLRPLMGLLSVLTLVGWGIVISAHDLNASQIASMALNVIFQVVVMVGVIFYYPKTKTPSYFTRRRLAA